MYHPLLALLLMGLAARALAFDFPVEVTEYIDDVKIIAYLNQREVDKEPQWTPFEGPPALSIADALEAVQHRIESDTELSEVTLTGIELKQIPQHAGRWHYLVKVRFKQDASVRPHFFVVLMDGQVISAVKRPDAIK
jgi:hypothetical protein